jgi:hypothetical protein
MQAEREYVGTDVFQYTVAWWQSQIVTLHKLATLQKGKCKDDMSYTTVHLDSLCAQISMHLLQPATNQCWNFRTVNGG